MGQDSQALGDGPDVAQAKCIHRQAAKRCQDPHAIGLALAVMVFPELSVTGPVPRVFDRLVVTHLLQQSMGCCSEARDVVVGLMDRLASAEAIALHRQDRGAARPVLHLPKGSRHAAQGPEMRSPPRLRSRLLA